MTNDLRIACVSPDLRPGVEAILRGFHDVGILDCFATTLGVRPDGSLKRWLGRLPAWGRGPIEKLIGRRSVPSFVGENTLTYAWREVVRVSANHFTRYDVMASRLWWWSERAFDKWAARELAGRVPFIYGFELASADTFRAQKRLNGWCILGQLIAHYRTAMSLYRQELDRYPETMTRYDKHLLSIQARVNALKDQQFAASDLIVANSEFVRQSFVDAGIAAKKVIVIPGAGPRPVPDSAPSQPDGRMIFITAGTLSIRKGTPYLLQAWQRIAAQSGCELWLFGKNTLPPQLVAGLPENVRMMGSVSSAELGDAFRRASVLVLPSLCEGFALVILEAMAHGLPVITTPNSGCGNFVEDGINGWVVPIRDPEALAGRLNWCMENPDALRSMGERSRRKAQDWTWEKYAGAHAVAILEFMRRTA